MANPFINVAIDRFAEQFALGTLRAFLAAQKRDQELQATIACEWEINTAAEDFAIYLANLVAGEDRGLLTDALVTQCRAALDDKVVASKTKPSRQPFA